MLIAVPQVFTGIRNVEYVFWTFSAKAEIQRDSQTEEEVQEKSFAPLQARNA